MLKQVRSRRCDTMSALPALISLATRSEIAFHLENRLRKGGSTPHKTRGVFGNEGWEFVRARWQPVSRRSCDKFEFERFQRCRFSNALGDRVPPCGMTRARAP